MTSPKLCVVASSPSDLLDVFRSVDPYLTVLAPDEEWSADFQAAEVIALLGGTQTRPMLLPPRNRVFLERKIANGTRVFAEYVASISNVYFNPPENTRFERLVCLANSSFQETQPGTLLDNQFGMKIAPHPFTVNATEQILRFVKVQGHDHVSLQDSDVLKDSTLALWVEHPNNVLVCAFQLSNFIRGRFAPKRDIIHLIEFILSWLYQETHIINNVQFSYTTGECPVMCEPRDFHSQVHTSAQRAIQWYKSAGILQHNGRNGVLEGLSTEIDIDGKQKMLSVLRADCIGESAMAFFFHGLLNSDEESHQISRNLMDLVFDGFQCEDSGPLFGMIRWTNEAWGVCYQDDVARAIIPQLLKCHITRTTDRLTECVHALRFLIRTTGSDGTRIFRTDAIDLTEERMNSLRQNPGNLPSAHYNAYYYAALLIAYKLTNESEFIDVALKGMTTLMDAYPNTAREQSETQEYCRMILPLSWLYWVTKDPIHQSWLYRVTEDLRRFHHPSGAYIEWDDGYTATMRTEIGTGESSLVSANGDPVVDLLYSNNWLPMAWIQAYLVTKDSLFLELWETSARFMLRAQIHSQDPKIDGAWARAYDVSRDEVFGTPADVGWGPWAIESGWTVGEITAGLIAGMLTERLMDLYY